MGRNFYIADTHFGHFNIIRYDNRPFSTVQAMDDAIIANWNKTVSSEDTVYILGDFSWYQEMTTRNILGSLNGHKVLVRGNHDKETAKSKFCFDKIVDYLEINDSGTKVILSHYPILFWNNQFHDSVHLYGHVHNSHQWNMCENWIKEARQLQAIPMRMYNVGCMMLWMNYTPKTLDEIIAGYKE